MGSWCCKMKHATETPIPTSATTPPYIYGSSSSSSSFYRHHDEHDATPASYTENPVVHIDQTTYHKLAGSTMESPAVYQQQQQQQQQQNRAHFTTTL